MRMFHDEVTEYLWSGNANREQARDLGIKIQQFHNDQVINHGNFDVPSDILKKRMLDILCGPVSGQDARFREILVNSGCAAEVQRGEYLLNERAKLILAGAASRMAGWNQIYAWVGIRAEDYLKSEEFEELARKLFKEQLELIEQDVRKKIVAEVDSEVKLVVENELSNAKKEVDIIVEVERKT